ncbi:5-oxoprolinase subunit C family protein [Rufibacter psychrotolerans]|uniref:5-oxoprolinase subunit C family protein n=1 Tax=Rufibacter psychrotolerans TaxID=2812556 RepID=UPI0019680859|nr:biotin-dependent carboxyltransferase family protein [Rufibacter sp. SYSU D00308]
MSLRVEKAGLLTTVQDLGRWGYQQQGVIVGGAMDPVAHRVANWLVGNAQEAATLEFTMLGPSLRFAADHLIALTGGSFAAQINGKAVPAWRPLLVRKGALLEVGRARQGARGYLAVAGGIQVPLVLGSASTYLRAGIGGLKGAPLQEQAMVPCPGSSNPEFPPLGWETGHQNLERTTWFVRPAWYQGFRQELVIRVLQGPEYGWFFRESQRAFWQQPFQVTPQSDRMGYRLAGPALGLAEPRELLSTAVTFGTVQVPPQGNPIVLMADHQTTGGYPRIGQVIRADLAALAQVLPGQRIRFQEVTLEEAYRLLYEQERHLAQLKSALSLKRKR